MSQAENHPTLALDDVRAGRGPGGAGRDVHHEAAGRGGALVAVVLVGAVLAAVHHAEVVAHRVGEPFGSLILAVAVTVIEVALIVTLMVSGGEDTSTLAATPSSPR